MKLNNQHIVVMGLARSGLAVARFLKSRGAQVTVTDKASEENLGLFAKQAREMEIDLSLGEHSDSLFESAEMIVISPGVPHTLAPLEAARKRGIAVLGEIELAARFITTPIVAVSGTNGKTTTTELIGQIFSAAGKRVYVGGNIGSPLIDVAGKDKDLDLVVAEISSFQLDTIDQFRPHVAILLNITADHLDRYSSMAGYAESKGRLFINQSADDFAVCHGSDDWVQRQCAKAKSQHLNFYVRPTQNGTVSPGAIVTPRQIITIIPGHPEVRIDLTQTALKGPHNRENIAAASLAALAVGIDAERIQQTIDTFQPLAHRLEPVATIDGIRFVNDSKATNVDAVIRALECYHQPVVLIMGGRNKGYDFNLLADQVRKRVKKLIVIGEAGPEIMTALAHVPKEGAETATDMDQAVRQAYASAARGDTVLLSPACASFDMFSSYTDRGETFRRSVNNLTEL